MSSRTKAFIAILIASLLWGTAGVAAKILVRDVHPFITSFYRFLIASICILPFFLREQKFRGIWKKLIPLSILGSIHVPLFYIGIQTTTANSSALIFAISPLATAFLSSVLIKEIHSKQKLIGIVLGFIGAVLIVLLPVLTNSQTLAGDLTGNLIIVGAMLCWTLYTIGSRRTLSQNSYSPITMTSLYFFTATALSFFLCVITRQHFFPTTLFSSSYIYALLYSGIGLTLITYFLYQWAIQRISVTTASLKQYLEPVVGVVVNALFLGETITLGFLFGSILIFLGVAIATGSRVWGMIKKNF